MHAFLRSKWLYPVKQRSLLVVWAMFLSLLPGVGAIATTHIATTNPVPKATATARVEQRQKQVRLVQPENYDLNRYPVTDANERHWRTVLWAMALREPQPAQVAQALQGILALTSRPKLSQPQMRTVDMAMQVGTQMYLHFPARYGSLESAFRQTIERSPDPQWVAMALSALAQGDLAPEELQSLSDRVRQRFPRWSQDVWLQTTLRDVAERVNPPAMPPLRDLLQWTIASQQPHLYVLCPRDRGLLCRAVLKDQSGQFVQQSGQLWSVPLLSRSLHDLAWNFERGETPQGIYRIEGVVPQPDFDFFGAYGQFALVKLFVPFESGVRSFLPGQKGRFTGTLAAYQALLPPAWRNYFPIQQTYWAGKAGRSLFRIHGSGEATNFFSGKERYPASADWNPTIGCLSALETYDESGRLRQADMPKILAALTATGGKNFSGYMIVVEVPDTTQISSTAAIAVVVNESTSPKTRR
ncbi:hypothetical protein NDA01_01965 [Trichocoleus desertorum AS-A10]|uniref:hypothetical protein n=1 Tax=Trichocoleus desertorum TaxID=1481672 RepID=UPI003296D242